jgi:hypothetical protein
MGKLGKEMARRNVQKVSKIARLNNSFTKIKRGNCAGDIAKVLG